MSLNHWDAAVIGVKTVAYAATLGAAGAVFFLRYGGALIADAQRLTIRRLVFVLAVLSIAAGAAHVVVLAGSMSGEAAGMWDGPLLRMGLQGGAGRAIAIRATGIILTALGVLSERPAWWALIGAAAAATSFAWTGHAHALHPDAIPMLLLGVHLLGVAFWLGALAPLRMVASGGNPIHIAAAAARFGTAAVFVVGGLIAAAVMLLWLMLGGLSQIWASDYGRYITLKLALVAGLLSLAAFNKLRLTPRLQVGDPAAVRGFQASIACEMLLAILILAVTAALTTLAGPPALD